MRSTGKSPLLCLVTLVTAAITLCAQVGPHERTSGQTEGRLGKSTRKAMINVLGSADANPSIGEEAETFDRLVGKWDADFTFYRADGSVFHKKGELLFGWVMDGRAVQDLWIGYPTEGQKERTIGTTIRFFDTALKQWRVICKSAIQLRRHCARGT